jgi:hypothetical protein
MERGIKKKTKGKRAKLRIVDKMRMILNFQFVTYNIHEAFNFQEQTFQIGSSQSAEMTATNCYQHKSRIAKVQSLFLRVSCQVTM